MLINQKYYDKTIASIKEAFYPLWASLSTGIGSIYNEITFLLIIMKTKTRDLSTCLKRRLWIVGVCLTTFSFLSVSVAYAVSDNQTVQQQKKEW